MRLQLIGIAIAIVAPSVAAQPADDRIARAGVVVYADDDRVTVWSPRTSVTVPLPHSVVVDVEATVDAVTAASADVTSTASPYAFTEVRTEAGVAARVAVLPRQWLGARAVVSDEQDYTSLYVGGSWWTEVAERNTTLGAEYIAAFDTVGRAGDAMFAESRRGHRLALTLTQVTDRAGYVDVVVDVDRSTGYLANPYRYVPIAVGGMTAYSLPERVPDERTAIAALGRVRRRIAGRWYSHADYRLCRDTWGITSHTVSAQALLALRGDALMVGVTARGYLQNAADFVRATYTGDDGAPVWRTRDRSLGTMRTLAAGATVDAVLPWRDLRVSGSLMLVRFAWPNDPIQRRRDAVISSLSLQLPF